MLTRRSLLRQGAGLTLLAGLPGGARAAPGYAGPNVVIVRFGGGVRRLETIGANTFSPWLAGELARRGTLFRNVVIDDAPHIKTGHGQGTLHLLTGRYDAFENLAPGPFGERFEPPAPTLFEYLRRATSLASHETLILNGENRASEEFYTFSNDHDYGIEYRSEVLSLMRYRTWHLRERIAHNRFSDTRQQHIAQRELEKLQRIDARQTEREGQGPVLDRFWAQWHDRFGAAGTDAIARHARGDRLITELASAAMQSLQPRLLLLNYQDPDYVHWGHASHYTRGITTIDRALRQLVTLSDQLPFYRDNTVFVVTPDCGRDANPLMRLPYQHHFNSRSAREVWALIAGPRVPDGVTIDREVQQIDVTSTVAALMGFNAGRAEGQVLHEAFT